MSARGIGVLMALAFCGLVWLGVARVAIALVDHAAPCETTMCATDGNTPNR